MNRLVCAKKDRDFGEEGRPDIVGLALLRPIFEIFKDQLGLHSMLIGSGTETLFSTLTSKEMGLFFGKEELGSWLEQVSELAQPGKVVSLCGLRAAAAVVRAGGKAAGKWVFLQREEAYLAAPSRLDQVAGLLPQMTVSLGDIIDKHLNVVQQIDQIDDSGRELLEHLELQSYIRDTFTTLLCFTDADEAVEYILASMGRRFNLSRACIFEEHPDKTTSSSTYEWCAPGVRSVRGEYCSLPRHTASGLSGFDNQGVFVCEDTAQLPSAQHKCYAEKNILATLQCLLLIGQESIGTLAFHECRYRRVWSESEISAMVMLSKIITTLILRRNMYATLIQAMEEMVEREQRIRKQLDLQDFINKVYEEVFTSDNTQDTIDRILEMVGRKYHVSRIGLCEASPNRLQLINTAEWCAPGIEPRMHLKHILPYAEYEDYCRQYHDRDGSFYCEDVRELETGPTDLFLKRSIISTLQTSIRVNNSIEGFIFVEECTGRHWSRDEVAALKLTTRALAAIVLRNRERDKLRQSYRMTDIILRNVNSWVYVVDAADFSIKYINKRMEQDLVKPAEMGQPCFKALSRGPNQCAVCPTRQLSADCNLGTVESYDPQRGIWYTAASSKIQWVDGSEVYIVAVNDIDQQKNKELKIQKTAFYDPMLNIKNRAAFVEDFDSPLIQGTGHKNVGAVIIFDVNDFKYINQTFGLAAGDGLLRQIAAYLTTIPNTQDRVYRYGGDEFLLILEGSDVRRAETVAAAISRRFEQVWRVNDNEYYCTVAMGIALYPEHGANSHEMIGTLDFAISEAKSIGRGSNQTVSFYNKLGERLRRKHMVLDALKQALKQDWFEVNYQPIYSPADRAFTKMEALLRLKSEAGVIYPTEFIPVAEETGLIKEIGLVVLDKVCATISRMLAKNIKFKNIHVNISAVQLMQDDFATRAMNIIRSHGIPPSKLEFEITESVLSSSIERVRQVISQLLHEGIAFAIDDFGTGYSNFSYIFSLPFNILKFDKAVIAQLGDNAISSTIIRSIISNCHEFGIQTVAEGIETPQQYRLLRSYGCDYIQGYLFAKPVPADRLSYYFGTDPLPIDDHAPHRLQQECGVDAEAPLRQAETPLPLLTDDGLPGGVYRCKTDICRTALNVSDGLLNLLGCTRQYLMEECGARLTELVHPDDRKRVTGELTLQLSQGTGYELEYRAVSTQGRTRWLLDQGRIFKGQETGEQYLQGLVVDITKQRAIRDEYEYICFHDPLTGLYNRAYFEREIAELAKRRGILVGLIYCDMDGLKLINDNLGHEVGDRLLISAAEIISKSVERGDVACRMGGDEFAVILMDCTEEKLMEKMEAIRNNVTINNQNPDALPVRISIGSASAVTNEDGLIEKLSMAADDNMYQDKRINITAAREFILKRITRLTDKKLL